LVNGWVGIDQIDLTMPQGSSQAALFVLSRASLPGNESPANALDTFERQRIRRAIGGRLFRHVERQHLRALLRLARSRYFALRSFDRERIAWDRELRSAARVVMYRALRRKVLGPLTTRAQDVHDPIHQLPDAAGLGRRDHERAIRGVVGAAAGSSRRTFNWTFTLLNDGIPAASGGFSAFCHGAHSAFSLRANTEACTADHHAHTRRSWSFFNDPASLRSWFLNDVVVRKGWRHDESCQGSTSENCSHGKSPFKVKPRLGSGS
jgi:hypothetical protein